MLKPNGLLSWGGCHLSLSILLPAILYGPDVKERRIKVKVKVEVKGSLVHTCSVRRVGDVYLPSPNQCGWDVGCAGMGFRLSAVQCAIFLMHACMHEDLNLSRASSDFARVGGSSFKGILRVRVSVLCFVFEFT